MLYSSTFVKQWNDYDNDNGTMITMNMHLHCHIHVVHDYGPIVGFWLFLLEKYNGILGRQPNNN